MPTLKLVITILILNLVNPIYAQTDTNSKWTFSGYGEMYYSYDFSNPDNHEKDNFIYNHKRHNELNLNLFFAKANYSSTITRANIGLMAGNYAQYNLSTEPTWAQFIYEANMGVKLSKKHSIWLDAGIMPSHLGFESAISGDCWTLTRSIMAENSPYYETGIKLSYTNQNEKLNVAFMVLNGWQQIQRPVNQQTPSIGFQLNYKPSSYLTLNYSNFLGTAKADSLKSLRAFHNLYVQYEPKAKLGVIVGFDIGTDKYDAKNYGVWYAPIVIFKYKYSKNLKMALRGEYYNDQNQIIITTNSLNGFNVSGISANIDYKITPKIEWRLEAKRFYAKDKIFFPSQNENYSLTTNLTFRI
jgi:hypothetical protein